MEFEEEDTTRLCDETGKLSKLLENSRNRRGARSLYPKPASFFVFSIGSEREGITQATVETDQVIDSKRMERTYELQANEFCFSKVCGDWESSQRRSLALPVPTRV